MSSQTIMAPPEGNPAADKFSLELVKRPVGPPGTTGEDGRDGNDGQPGPDRQPETDAPAESIPTVDYFCFDCPAGPPRTPGNAGPSKNSEASKSASEEQGETNEMRNLTADVLFRGLLTTSAFIAKLDCQDHQKPSLWDIQGSRKQFPRLTGQWSDSKE
ncbi:unnamed protein product [Caenorhabditis nigoni]